MASVENLIETISNSDEVIKNITINILISATSLEELRKVENEFKMLCLKHNFDYSENLFQQQEALFDYFPSTFSFSSNQQIISSTSVAASYPFFLQNITDPNGIIIGKTHKGFFFFNLFHQDDTRPNSNMFIIGKSGYGKSFTSRKIIYQELIKGTKVFILDPEREYINIPKTFKNSTVLDVGDGSQLTINPLQFFTVSSSFENQIADHLSFLESFFSILLPELDYLNIRLLMDCFLKFYQQWFQKHKTSPIIKDFIKFLKTKKHKTLLLSFSVFQQGYKENEL
jgi:type IV secretory pathway VirB4 component